MSHGLWYPSGKPSSTLTKATSVRGDSADVRVVRGDRVTAQKGSVRVEIFVEYKDKHVVEGTVQKAAGNWSKGQWVSVPRSAIIRNKKVGKRITSNLSKAEEADMSF